MFLLRDVIDSFESYVESEEFVRNALAEHRGQPLQEWKRDFILNRALRPTRRAVIGRRIVQVEMDRGWMVPGSMYFDTDAVRHNRVIFERWAATWKHAYRQGDAAARPEFKDARRDSPRNILIEDIPVGEVLNFLLDVRIRSLYDSTDIAATALSLVKHRDESGGQALADVILVGNLSTAGLTGRSLTAEGKINNLFVGESPKGAASIAELNYVGDRALYTPGRVTLHLRYLKLRPDPKVDPNVGDCVPWFSVHLPEAVARDCIIEEF